MTEKKINILLASLALCFFFTLILVLYNTRYTVTQNVNQSVITGDTNYTTVDLNSATREELMLLPGIGEARADKIIAYRTDHPFKHISELINVPGIGEDLYRQLEGRITVQ